MSQEPIKAGDLAEVISSKLGTASPNIGLIVSVVSLQGEHSQYGRIWRCEAQDWLRKINPPPLPTKKHIKNLVLSEGES